MSIQTTTTSIHDDHEFSISDGWCRTHNRYCTITDSLLACHDIDWPEDTLSDWHSDAVYELPDGRLMCGYHAHRADEKGL